MSGKTEKRVRKEVRKRLKTFDKQVKDELNRILRPAPKWIPKVIWYGLAKIFLNI